MSPILGSRGISPRGYGFAGASKPNAPVSVSATDVGTSRAYNDGAAIVSFSSGGDNGSPITSYTVTSSPGGFTASGASSPLTVTGLQSGVSYTFTATATNSVGTSDASSASSAITATTVPQAPTIGTATCASSQAYTGSANISVAFTAGATGGKAVSTYTATSSGDSATQSGGSSPISFSRTIGSSYTFTVTATNANGTSQASSSSNSVLSASVPQTPTISSVGINSTTNVTVNWSGASGGSSITSVTVTSSPSLSLTYSGTSTAMSVTGSFAANQSYTFTMTTTNAYGTSSTSNGVASTPNPIIPQMFMVGGNVRIPAGTFASATPYSKRNTDKFRYDTQTASASVDNMYRFWYAMASLTDHSTKGFIAGGFLTNPAPGTSLNDGGSGGFNLAYSDKIAYATETWSAGPTYTGTLVSGQYCSSLNNGTTASVLFLNAGVGSGTSLTAYAEKMTHPTETFSQVRSWTISSNGSTPFSAPNLSWSAHSKMQDISNAGTRGYLPRSQGASYADLIRWEYSTDNYSTVTGASPYTAAGNYANSYWNSMTNHQVAGYLFVHLSTTPILKFAFSTETIASTGQYLSGDRVSSFSNSYSAGGAGYISGGIISSNYLQTTDKYTYNTETRSTLSVNSGYGIAYGVSLSSVV